MELHVVSYGIDSVARPLLLFFSSENRLLWFRYREYDLAHLKLIFEFSIYTVWKSVRYGVSKGLDTAYWGRIELVSFVVFGECRHGYAVSSLMDTTHDHSWKSKSTHDVFLYKLLNLLASGFSQRFCLYPLGEVVNCYDDELEFAGAFLKRSQDVEAPLVKWHRDMLDVKHVFDSLGIGVCIWHESHLSTTSLVSRCMDDQ
ncbi:hypothetical protein Tco_1282990 [Tanacetum coccineum]